MMQNEMWKYKSCYVSFLEIYRILSFRIQLSFLKITERFKRNDASYDYDNGNGRFFYFLKNNKIIRILPS